VLFIHSAAPLPSTRGGGGVSFIRPAAQFLSTRGAGGVSFIRPVTLCPSLKVVMSVFYPLRRSAPLLRGARGVSFIHFAAPLPSTRGVRGCVIYPFRRSAPLLRGAGGVSFIHSVRSFPSTRGAGGVSYTFRSHKNPDLMIIWACPPPVFPSTPNPFRYRFSDSNSPNAKTPRNTMNQPFSRP